MTAFKSLESRQRRSVSTSVVDSIRQAISRGELSPGDRLPSERDMAAMLNVSRATVRTALKTVDGMGLIVIRHGSGIYVASGGDLERTIRRVATSLLLQKQPSWDLFEIRETLEREAAGWAARRATPRETNDIRRLYAEYRKRFRSGELDAETVNRYDTALHRLIIVATKNAVLARVMNNLTLLLEDSRKMSILMPGRLSKSVQEMGRIVHAIEERDVRAAKREMLAHLRNGRRALSITPFGQAPRGRRRTARRS